MRYLLDASALLPLVTGFGKELIGKGSREWLATTDLGLYEACNSLWKLSTLLRSIPVHEGTEVAAVLGELTRRDVIHLVSIAGVEIPATFRLACDENLTFYDASYVTAARQESAVLVTEDVKLRELAEKHIKTISYSSLCHKLG